MTAIEFSKIAQYSKERGNKLDLVRLVNISGIGLKNSKEFTEEVFGFSNVSESTNTGRILYNRLVKKYPEAKENIKKSDLHETDSNFKEILTSFKYKEKVRK